MIEMLHEDILLEIFDFYRLNAIKRSRGRPWKWYPLARVCRRWRYVLTASPSRLGLQIFCKPRAPIEHILDSWPTLPLVIRYKYPKSKSLPDNIISALRRPGRVREIDLFLPWSLMQSTIEMIQDLVPDIVDALTTQDMATGVLPELTHLYLKGYRQSPSVAKAAAQFVAARRHSGRTISLFN